MKNLRILLFVVPAIILACNSQPKADKNMNDDALLVEDAKVKDSNENAGYNETESVEDFVKEAASGGLMEVELGRYAQQNGVNQRVKNFGAMMVRDHSKANDELKSVAAGKNLQVPSSMEEKHMNMLNDIKKKTGTGFDTEYMKHMVDDHEKDVDKFRKQTEDGKDAEIKAFASKTLPVLEKHLDSARSIRNSLK